MTRSYLFSLLFFAALAIAPGCKPAPEEPGAEAEPDAATQPQEADAGSVEVAQKAPVESPPKDPREDPKAQPVAKKSQPVEPGKVAQLQPSEPLKAAAAPAASPRLTSPEKIADLPNKLIDYANAFPLYRSAIQLDKPLYQPGETIWYRLWDIDARRAVNSGRAAMVKLLNPGGAEQASYLLYPDDGALTNAFDLPPGAAGGSWAIEAEIAGQKIRREFQVASYETPRIKKRLDFRRKAYGPGDTVEVDLALKRNTGAPLSDLPIAADLRLDGQALPVAQVSTNASGEAVLRFDLPAVIERGDGMLTVRVDDSGLTESITRRVPIVLNKVSLNFYPEGGDLVAGLPSRVYFEARTPLDKAADIKGQVLDNAEQVVAEFDSYAFGLGRFDFTPEADKNYRVRITKPAGVEQSFTLPEIKASGCVLRTYDDLDGELETVRAGVYCSKKSQVHVVATARELPFDQASVEAGPTEPGVVYLTAQDPKLAKNAGVVRLTLFNDDLEPLAERLFFRQRRGGLQVSVEPEREALTPRDQVKLVVKTLDGEGNPVAADLALAVVDDTVINLADDREGHHLLSALLLEPELEGKIDEPKFFFDLSEEKAPLALELLVGARGYRRFEWRPVLDRQAGQQLAFDWALPLLPPDTALGLRGQGKGGGGADLGVKFAAKKKDDAKMLELAPVGAAPEGVEALPEEEGRLEAMVENKPMPIENMPVVVAANADDEVAAAVPMEMEMELAEAKEEIRQRRSPVTVAPQRVFPVPSPERQSEIRSDFRQTVFWEPRVHTNDEGVAELSFPLSDAVTSFSVQVEGIAGSGLMGRSQHMLKSELPLSVDLKLPVEVSTGDKVKLPMTLINNRDAEFTLTTEAKFGPLLEAGAAQAMLASLPLEARSRQTLYLPVEVKEGRGLNKMALATSAGELSDQLVRELRVVPRGFPFRSFQSGAIQGEPLSFEVDMGSGKGLYAGLVLTPSTASSLQATMEAMLREPSGCFEQTSSSTYPNLMVLDYLQRTGQGAPELRQAAYGYIERGYQRLAGYESEGGGFEWFGGTPAHEALTAYGILEFTEMKRVYQGVDDAMLERTIKWLRSRKNGQGGFHQDQKHLDSFGGAPAAVADAYISYSLAEAGALRADEDKDLLASQSKLAASSKDPYLIALAALTLLRQEATRGEGAAAAARLAQMQGSDGSWAGAQTSITSSRGNNLLIESTALAALVLQRADAQAYSGQLAAAEKWLVGQATGLGGWGATQATILTLKALLEIWGDSAAEPGTLEVLVDDKVVATLAWEANQLEPLAAEDLGQHFSAGKHTLTLRQTEGSQRLPFFFMSEYFAEKGEDSPSAPIAMATQLEKQALAMGESTRLTVDLENTSQEAQAMVLARVGIPGGMSAQSWQLDELVDKEAIAFYETRQREVILYFRGFEPGQKRSIPIELVADIPGEFKAPASQAYLYYDSTERRWVDGLEVAIATP